MYVMRLSGRVMLIVVSVHNLASFPLSSEVCAQKVVRVLRHNINLS